MGKATRIEVFFEDEKGEESKVVVDATDGGLEAIIIDEKTARLINDTFLRNETREVFKAPLPKGIAIKDARNTDVSRTARGPDNVCYLHSGHLRCWRGSF